MTKLWLAVGVVVLSIRPTVQLSAQSEAEQGKVVYEKWCAQCHGETGEGDGPAAHYMYPRPRNFVAALYQIRSTASGLLPTDADIMHAIDNGLPGTTMPGWKDKLSSGDRRALLAYIKTFSSFFADSSQLPQALEFGGAPGGGAEAIRLGKQFYDSIGCHKCHGPVGRGNGPSAPTLKDDDGMPMFAADLTQGWRFNGGFTVEDIYRRLRTGIDGTPMPSFSDLLDQKFVTDEELWRVAQYVASLSSGEPEIRDVIRAARSEGPALPGGPADSTWAAVDTYYFPLVAQIIHKPRWFAPAVDGVWVQAVHNGDTVAVRVSWHDRSQSPDTAWLAHIRRVYANMSQDDTVPAALHPDQLVLQFPRTIPSGMERPYFLMGSAQDPAYQWRWTSAGGGAASAGTARGLERFEASPGGVGAEARFDRGEWSVVFRRALATADTANELQFRTGRAIPVSFFAWDGSNGEYGGRMALSSWYFLALDEPTPLRVYVSPVIAVALTLGLGMLWIRRAQRDAGSGRRG